ncbi:hypothetical protein L6164_024515 [Bauhinia variegata]|uniref:Uncharacterized protein n=1 Tax=Bauhinia variegata TaxID=167791 RepID=A0ACB9LYN0_BAUVA|nr:hypothetical protein L6164_024515 [Bauhinia variegata]
MENDIFNASVDMAGRNFSVIDQIPQHQTPNPLVHCYSFDLNDQTRILNGISMLAGVQSEPSNNVHAGVRLMNPPCITDPDSNSLVTPQGKNIVGNASLGTSSPIENSDLQEQLAGVTPISPGSLAAILAARIGFQENFERSAALSPSVCSLEALGPCILNNWQDSSNPLFAAFGDRGFDEVPVLIKWNESKFPKPPELNGTGFQPYSSIGNMDPNGWTSSSNGANLTNHPYNLCNFSNELSLSLATSPNAGQCSDVSCSDVTHYFSGTRSGLDQISSSSRELSLSLNSNKHVQFSQAILGSRYLNGIQEILAQIARYSLENLEPINSSAAGFRAGASVSNSAFPPKKRSGAIDHNANSILESHTEPTLQRHAAESKKTQLLTLLQLVDSRYNQCLDEIHTVVSAFHAATELDPHIHAHFALQTISTLYKDLRERISNYILATGANFNNSCSEEREISAETSFIQQQWALQQLKRKDHQLWRPQRGLPERSVSVLRAWMFQNFLHPYPKDAEKHLLAVKSGLTRSQVSNWFINARVRLWKPMIEEMYAEMNKRKGCRNEEGTESSHRSRIGMSNQRFNIN